MPPLSALTYRLRGLFAKNVVIRYGRYALERMREREAMRLTTGTERVRVTNRRTQPGRGVADDQRYTLGRAA